MQNFEVISSRLYPTILKSFVFLYTHLFYYYYINIPKRSYRRETIRTFEIKHTAVNILVESILFQLLHHPPSRFLSSHFQIEVCQCNPKNTSTMCNPNLKTLAKLFKDFCHWQYVTSSLFAITTKRFPAKMYSSYMARGIDVKSTCYLDASAKRDLSYFSRPSIP